MSVKYTWPNISHEQMAGSRQREGLAIQAAATIACCYLNATTGGGDGGGGKPGAPPIENSEQLKELLYDIRRGLLDDI